MKIVIIKEGIELDISDRTAVIYGAGLKAIELIEQKPIIKISHIVDKDPNKWGKNIQLANSIFEIESPDVLRELSNAEHYIVISSELYYEEMLEDILRIIQVDFIICKKKEIGILYDNIFELLMCDSYMQFCGTYDHNTLLFPNFINRFRNIIEEQLQGLNIKFYKPVCDGHSVQFIFGSDEEKYVFKCPGIYSSSGDNRFQDKIFHQKSYMECVYKVKMRQNLDELLIYEDSAGFMLLHYADEKLDFTRQDAVEQVLKKIHKIHQIKDIAPEGRPIQMAYYRSKMGLEDYFSSVKLQQLDNSVCKVIDWMVINSNEQVLSHGDLHYKNIVGRNQKPYFIDWECMQMAHPMKDVITFLGSIAGLDAVINSNPMGESQYPKKMNNLYECLKKDLMVYYGRTCEKSEYCYAYAMMIVQQTKDLYARLRRFKGENDVDYIVNDIISRINTFMIVRKELL